MARESKTARKLRAQAIVQVLADAYPRSRCALNYETPFQLLCATVLSAQTTDVKVNQVTPLLFDQFPSPVEMAAADVGAIESCIQTIGLWRNKAKFLKGLSQMLLDDFAGELPTTVAELTRLPGVARKTATAVLGTAMGLNAGITVDTHMLRINALLKLSTATSADKMSKELEDLVPQDHWNVYTHRIIDHGRLVCVARRPRCGVCPLADLCPSHKSPKAGYKPANDDKEPASAAGLSWLG